MLEATPLQYKGYYLAAFLVSVEGERWSNQPFGVAYSK